MPLSLLIKVSLLAALGAVLMQFNFPLIPAHPYLRYDPSEVPALVASFALGPLAGMAIVTLKNVLYVISHFQPTELVGIPLNTLAGCSLVGVAGWVYQGKKSKTVAVLSLVLGVLAMTLVMIPANLVLLPLFQKLFAPTTLHLSPDQLLTVLLVAVTPFNLLKGGLTSLLTFAVYKRVSPFLKSVPRWEAPEH
jgi:riboflavin transporter FmnP